MADRCKLILGTFREPVFASGYTESELDGILQTTALALPSTHCTIGHSSD